MLEKKQENKDFTRKIANGAVKFAIPLMTAALSFFTLMHFNNNMNTQRFLLKSQEASNLLKTSFQPYEASLQHLNEFLNNQSTSLTQYQVDLFLDEQETAKNLPLMDKIFYFKRVAIEDFSNFHQEISSKDYLTQKQQLHFDRFSYFSTYKSNDFYVTKYVYSNPQIKENLIGSLAPKAILNGLKATNSFSSIISPSDFNLSDDDGVPRLLLSVPFYNPNNNEYSGALALSLKLSNDLFKYASLDKFHGNITIINPKENKQILHYNTENVQDSDDKKQTFSDTIYILGQPFTVQISSSIEMSTKDKSFALLIALLSFAATYILIYLGIYKKKEQEKQSQDMIENFQNLSNEINTDSLTTLYNRRRFFSDISKKVADSNASKNMFILFLDLDGFKAINDHIGHAAGDEVLRQYAIRLKEHPLTQNSTIYRMGGDEFVILFENKRIHEVQIDVKDLLRFAHEILKITDTPFFIKDEYRRISQSIGISRFVDETPEELLTNADTAMYEAKRLGKNRVVYYSKSLHDQVTRRNEIIKMLQVALEENEFHLVFQPKMYKHSDGYTHKGAEVLMRWESKKLGIISPQIFIPIAEEAGIIPQIDNWLIEESAKKIRELADQDICPLFSINISAKQFSNEGLPEYFVQTLEKYKIKPNQIIIEITESATIKEPESAKNILKKFRNYGFGISVDDFGTGYSSISYLRQFPVTEIKFDKSFTRNINVDEHDEIIISGLSSIAQQLHLDIVLEGVETEHQISWIEKHIPGAIIQGYFFSKPLILEDFINFSNKFRSKQTYPNLQFNSNT